MRLSINNFSYILNKNKFYSKLGNVGIGTTSPARKLSVNGDAGGTTAWNNDSDERLKKNSLTIMNALEKVQKLRGVNFEWKATNTHPSGNQMGFIAQEALLIIPEVVTKPGEYYSKAYSPITALLTEAIKKQQVQIKEQQYQIKELKAEKDTELASKNAEIKDIKVAYAALMQEISEMKQLLTK